MNTKAEFLPFHAINEFMMDDYRKEVLKTVIGKLKELPGERQRKISGLIRRNVKVQGFRNSSLAPLPLKIKGAVENFEKSPVFVAEILEGWCELNKDLSEIIFGFLNERNWETLPVETDRSKLPGFLTRWPANETFDGLISAFHEKHKEFEVSDNDISLMVVWISNRLPYDLAEEPEEESEEDQ